MRPFLKWAGGKYRLLNRLRAVLPAGERLVEPFVGSGAVFLNVDYPKYLLGEVNPDVIHLYRQLKTDGDKFISLVNRYFRPENNNKETYLKFREEFNRCRDLKKRAALFIYLNRHGYNGLCRYNSLGEFNVPFGRYDKPSFPQQSLTYFSQRVQDATLLCEGFLQTMSQARKGDVVYCDPPYDAISKTENFTNYSGVSFTRDDQIALAKKAIELARKKIPVVISNHDTPFTRELYSEAEIISFDVQRFISRDTGNRKRVSELIAVFR